MHYHASPEVRAIAWDKNFPNQIPDSPVVATTPPGNTFELEGNELRIVEVGHTDTDNTTVLHVPSIGLVVAGDVVYRSIPLVALAPIGAGSHGRSPTPARRRRSYRADCFRYLQIG